MWLSSRGRKMPPEWRHPQLGGWTRQWKPNPPPAGPGTCSPHDLVRYLSQYQAFSASLLRIQEDEDLQPAQLCRIASIYPYVFHLNDEVVELRPQLDICDAHHGFQGCRNFHSCEELHICREYVLKRCSDDHNCVLGHRWRTGHNKQILKSFFLEGLEIRILRKLVKSLLNPDDGKLQVCYAHSEVVCKQASGQEKGENEKKNVQSVREEREEDDAKMSARRERSNEENHVSSGPSSEDDSDGSEVSSSSESDIASISHKAKKKKNIYVSFAKESIRPRKKTGSRRYSWQVSDGGTTWINLDRSQITRLERAFRDPSLVGVDLPPLASDALGTRDKKDLFVLLGPYSWRATFETMSLTNSYFAKTLEIHRWCGNTDPERSVKLPKFLWYYKGPDGKWIIYDVHSSGESDHVSNITSEDIEKHFLEDPSTPMSFQNSECSYEIDFNTMKQTNLDSGVSRKVVRRLELQFDLNKEQKDLGRLLSLRRLPSVHTDACGPVPGDARERLSTSEKIEIRTKTPA